MPSRHIIALLVFAWIVPFHLWAEDQPVTVVSRPKRVLLLGQKPDSHPPTTHEYMAGVRLLAKLMQSRGGLQTVVVQADNPWREGPELLDGADGAVIFLTQGAKWVTEDADRLAAFQRLAKRGGGLSCLHWGMGTQQAEPIADFVQLFGCCHGGPDRKYKVLTATMHPTKERHPILSGLGPVEVREEFYYALKQPPQAERLVPLIQVPIDGEEQTVAWSWERPDGGRSFGFSGLHYHDNWRKTEYRRLVLQGVLWTVGHSISAEGMSVDVTEDDLAPAPQPEAK